ncbi:DEAD-box ATP-dependent RNA helicase 13 [Lycium ferocissimum]|uniref:DEAD-box ATP-dependent RNA helicase 13 n=1 Tax=Lycium ferocissimum TaxID=112874 RepID=UPI002815F662|nr:DEAD-box ATP-dependent RNA helicase 13 [Lycium ferocissimum]
MASQSSDKKKRPNKKKRNRVESEEFERINSLKWNPTLTEKDDAFSFLIGSNELEGGFLSLEEIDESEYNLDIAKSSGESEKKGKTKLKKQKVDTKNEELNSEAKGENEEEIEEVEKEPKQKKNKKNKKKKKKKDKINNNAVNKVEGDEESPAVTDGNDDREQDSIDETEEQDSIDENEYYAWNELRLHPLLMKSIYALKFKEPTPIQKACIPAAAHQGKDVVGAAETGSGKTLAFGLPILQRLLEEQEKAERQLPENGELDEKVAPTGLLRALIITPTRELALQVTDHLKEAARHSNFRVVPIVGGMSSEKQERLLRTRPEIVVGTPGRLWELMSGGETHLVELHSLSFFVLDEADRMIENGHFHELQSIVDMLPMASKSTDDDSQKSQNCETVSSVQRKKRQTFVFSATIALSADFRKKLKRGSQKSKANDELNSIETLSERAGMKADAAIIDLTNASILANKLEESFIDCREEDKDGYLYYILSVHGRGRTIVFCTSIAALRHISSLLRILGVNVWTLHAQMQQRARLKAIDRFRGQAHGILIATDVAARGLDIPGVRTVIHYQLPHSAEVYVHRSGRTARAHSDGCSIALITPNDTSKFAALCKSFSKENFKRFPLEMSYMPEVMKRLSLARQIDKISRKDSQDKAKKNWLERSAELMELVLEEDDSEEERVNNHKQRKSTSAQLTNLQEELKTLLSRPLQPKTFSKRYLAGAGVSPLLQNQLEELARQKNPNNSGDVNRKKLVVIGQDCVEPLQALRSAGPESNLDLKNMAERRRDVNELKRKRKDTKKRLREQKRKQKKKLQGKE